MAKKAKRRGRKPARKRAPSRADRQPTLEALSVILQVAPGRDAPTIARQIARRVGLRDWRMELVVESGTEVELVPPNNRTSPARAWDLTYALRDQPEVVHAEPLFRYLVPENAPQLFRIASGGGGDDPATDTDYEWSLRKTKVPEAWRLFGARSPGAGVQVGHPDTGYTPHPELADPWRVLSGAGFDFVDDDPDPADELDDGFLRNPSHGTGTGSVILSGIGSATGGPGPFVSGAAPFAQLIPIRTTKSVVLFSMQGLRKAVDHAATHGAQVVSISLGGPFAGFGLQRAIQRAIDAGVIVLAAAGNDVGFVVYPALFDEVIAVAASNIRDQPWAGSSHGDAVDITAPGESVWRARTVRDDASRLKFLVERGNGTSFAVATTAGIAALWVSFHGWPTLVRKYGAGGIARVFKQLLQSTCRTPSGWDTHQFGAGIADANKLLAAPLPAALPARKLRDSARAAVAMDTTGLEALVHLMPGASRARVEETVAALVRVPDRDLPSFLQTYGDEIAFQLVMHGDLLDTVQVTARGGRAAVASRTAAKRRLLRSGLSSRLRRRLARA